MSEELSVLEIRIDALPSEQTGAIRLSGHFPEMLTEVLLRQAGEEFPVYYETRSIPGAIHAAREAYPQAEVMTARRRMVEEEDTRGRRGDDPLAFSVAAGEAGAARDGDAAGEGEEGPPPGWVEADEGDELVTALIDRALEGGGRWSGSSSSFETAISVRREERQNH